MTANDQQHINTAYAQIRAAVTELAQVRLLDGELCRLLSDLYRSEDTLWQYITNDKVAAVSNDRRAK